jgi:hypothetical protein
MRRMDNWECKAACLAELGTLSSTVLRIVQDKIGEFTYISIY